MDTSPQVPTLWNQLAETMYLKDSAEAEVRLSEPTSFSFGNLRSTEGLAEIAPPITGELGYIVVLQLKAIPFIEQHLGGKKVSAGSYPIGAVTAIDLRIGQDFYSPIHSTRSLCISLKPRWMRLHTPIRRHGLSDWCGRMEHAIPSSTILGNPSSIRWIAPIMLRSCFWTTSCSR